MTTLPSVEEPHARYAAACNLKQEVMRDDITAALQQWMENIGGPACHQTICGNSQMTHVWFWNSVLSGRRGQKCRVLAVSRRGKQVPCHQIANPSSAKGMNSALVEFEDGYRVVTSRYAVRRIKP